MPSAIVLKSNRTRQKSVYYIQWLGVDMREVSFFKPMLDEREEEAVLRILRSGWLTTGKETLDFEKDFADFVGAKYALAVNSASNGLMLSFDACGVSKGTAIITSPYTFASSATSAIHLGANILYADINADDYNINPDAVEKLLIENKNVKAILPIHIGGNICRMDALKALAKKYAVKLVEDAAHAFPAKVNNAYAGTLADAGVFSFYATKTMTTAEGGMICTNDDKIASRIKIMRMHGIDRPIWERYTSTKASWIYDLVDAGWKCNLPDILSAIGRVQLQKANDMLKMRSQIVQYYNERFLGNDCLLLPPNSEGNAWHLYILRIVPEALKISRDEFVSELQKQGLGISMHFIPHFHMTYFKKTFNLRAEDFPNAERQFQSSLSLPLYPGMSDDDVEYVADTVLKTVDKFKR